MKSVSLRIHGKVQGVWYRGWTVEQARELGLTGWVRNRRDGTVEAIVCGAEDRVDELVRRCHNGPKHAKVVGVIVSLATNPELSTFDKAETV